MRTIDSGETWSNVSPATADKSFKALAFNGIGTGLAFGNSGMAFRTTNGGADWIDIQPIHPSAAKISIESVFFFGDNTAWCGSLNRMFRTDDAGATTPFDQLGDANWLFGQTAKDIAFVEPFIGFAVGSTGTSRMVMTINAGDSWTTVDHFSSYQGLTFIQFVDQSVGFTGGNEQMAKTIDGGASWQSLDVPAGVTLHDAYFIDENIGIAVGSNDPKIIRTTNGGSIWQEIDVSQLFPMGDVPWFFGITFKDENKGWIVGVNGTILATNDGGQTWNDQSVDELVNFFDVAVVE
jgi:photosystem II stability/assembly factor-like uncharacterized protein